MPLVQSARRSSCLRVVLGGLTAVGLMVSGSSGAAARQQAPDGYPAEGQPAIVKLISSGAEPRMSLRYRPAAGSTARMDIRMAMNMAMDMGGMTMPAMTMPVMTLAADITVTDVAESGDISYRMTLVDAGAESAPGVDPAMLSMIQGMLRGNVKGFSGGGTVSSRGLPLSIDLDLAQIGDPQMRQSMESMASSFEQLSIPMPEEPVGVGGRWEAYQRLASSGVVMYQKIEMIVKALEGNTVTFDVKLEQQAPPRPVTNAELPPEAQMTLQKLSASGTGTTTVDLTSLVQTSSASTRSTSLFEISIGGNNQTMTMETTLQMTMTPGAR